ncbi:non-structural maintenance of chromosomes element 1 homolog [Punica granatum]|uniref:Non-structural maintenance of chromosomes element 1 homolog n=2 Tax=Punica granatum TaxID=22663 RepID=A0A218WAH3_PUNGR|nr:non-structural maintenance of chromosomes element 1 homolog [Punica granatum]XP_031400308.1 non-structural maintenance of chromosomes element 1 homolog [Punica granatum]OWM69082.1 hypothetical protein CDL15_Pgr025269 [Punica granatum]PKI73293.1 hypothetical protein CRG98_006231 [Punica granatum]
MAPPLTDGHKVLIQALLSRGPLPEEDFHSIFSGVTGKNPANHQQVFNDYLLKINRELSYVNCEVRGCRNQNDGNVHYGFVNNVADEESKLGTKYSVPQIAFYRAIIEAIVQDAAAQGSISGIEALNVRLENQVQTGAGSQSQDHPSTIPAAFRNFSLSQKEKTLEELTRDRWLYISVDDRVGLGIRSFLDLRSWFRSNDIPSCEVCNEAAVKAELCPNENCTARIHEYCLKQRFSQRRAERTCPSCGNQWGLSIPKAEEVDEEDEPNPVQTQPPLASRKKRLRTGEASRASALSQPPPDVSGPRRTTRSSARLS